MSKKVLIAHQSAIPHYRVVFFEALQRQLKDDIVIQVVDEKDAEKKKLFFPETFDRSSVEFKVRLTKTIFLIKSKKVNIQTFIFNAFKYDLIIVENAVNNLAYPLSIFYKLFGVKIASL